MNEVLPEEAIRLQQAREARGFKSARDAALFFGWKYDSYAQHENGTRGLARAYKKYAQAFRVSEAWLLTGDGQGPGDTEAPPKNIASIPLVSWISAGALGETAVIDNEEDVMRHEYAVDLDPNGDWIALRVDGRSMDKISPHDSIIFVNRNDKALIANACYVIADGEGGATYKRYRPPNKFEPVSTKAEEFDTITFEPGQEPEIIGRVRKTVLSL